MDPPSTPSRPRQLAHGPPKRPSTTSGRVTRSRAAFQNTQAFAPPSSSLSPPPPEREEQGGAGHHNTHLTVPAETQSNNNIIIDETAAAPVDGDQAPILNASTSATTPKKRRIPAEEEDSNDGPLLSEYMCPICFSPPIGAIVTLCGHIMCGGCLYGAITARVEPKWDPARSGVVGLEVLTLGVDAVV
ncbi:hypothetical protein RSAG8_04159, partial [Rhizoctonia solani AG-8 WAC10335]